MGVIVRQSTKYSILNYLGAGLGILSTLFVYPLALESYGMVRWFVDIGSLAAPFVMLGAGTLSVRYFPDFQSKENPARNPLIGLLLVWTLLGILLFSGLWILFSGSIQDFFESQSLQRRTYYPILYPLTLAIIIGVLLNQYASNYKRIVVPSLLYEILIKISLPLLIIGIVYWTWSMDVLVYGVVFTYILSALGLIVYLWRLGAFSYLDYRATLTRIGFSPVFKYAIFGVFTSLGAILALRIDRVMVGYLLGDRLNGIFSIVVTLGIFMEIPFRSVLKISAPMVSQALSKGAISEVEHIYKRSSISLMIIGAFLFTGIWWLVGDVFSLMPKGGEIATGTYVIFYYGLAVWINMITSVNTEIIGFSQYYRFNLYAFLFLAVLNVVMNWIFIQQYGMVGASIATLVSISLFNLAKSGFIWKKFRIHPFSRETFLTLGLMLFSWGLLAVLPTGFSPMIGILVKGILITICFGAGIIWLNLSPELLELIRRPVAIFFPGKKKS